MEKLSLVGFFSRQNLIFYLATFGKLFLFIGKLKMFPTQIWKETSLVIIFNDKFDKILIVLIWNNKKPNVLQAIRE